MDRDAQITALAAAKAEIAAGHLPEIFLKKGRKLQKVTPEQAAVVMEKYAGDRGSDEVDDIPLFNAAGERIGFVSYNGRTWLGEKWPHTVEIPQRGRRTCVEQDRIGWGNG